MFDLKTIIQEIIWMALRQADDNNIDLSEVIRKVQSYGIKLKEDHVLNNIVLTPYTEEVIVPSKVSLIDLIKEIQPLALSYVHGRSTYAVSLYNDQIKTLSKYTEVNKTMLAKDGMFDKEFFERESKKDKFIKGLK